MFGLPGSPDEDKIFLIDFGLSSRSVTTVVYSGKAVARGFLQAFFSFLWRFRFHRLLHVARDFVL